MDRIWLKKINKPMLTWITFPCYSCFSRAHLFYRLPAALRRFRAYTELHIVDVLPNGERAELRAHLRLNLLPANAKYPMHSAQKYASCAANTWGRGVSETREGDAAAHGDNFQGGCVCAGVDEPALPERLVAIECAALVASVRPTADGWQLTVENRSGKPIPTARPRGGGEYF